MKGSPMQRNFGIGSPAKQQDTTVTYKNKGKSITYDKATVDEQKRLDKNRQQNKENLIDDDPAATIEFWKKKGLNPDGSLLKPTASKKGPVKKPK